MTDLMEDGDSNLALEVGGIREGLLERPAVDHDPVGERAGMVGSRAEAVVPAEEVGLVGVLVLDHHCDILERGRDLLREAVQRRLDVGFELGQ